MNLNPGGCSHIDVPTLRVGNIILFVDGYSLRVGERQSSLTRNEYRLLFELMRYPGRVLSMDHLARLDGDTDEPPSDRAIRARVAAIRHKLAEANDQIKNVRGVGYQISER